MAIQLSFCVLCLANSTHVILRNVALFDSPGICKKSHSARVMRRFLHSSSVARLADSSRTATSGAGAATGTGSVPTRRVVGVGGGADGGEAREPFWVAKKPIQKQARAKLPIEPVAPGIYRYTDGKTYRVASAAIVERFPVIVREPEPWRAEHMALMWQHERETSREVGERVLDKAQQVGVGAKPSAAGKRLADASGKKTLAQLDAEARDADATIDELVKFRPAPRHTAADAANDVRSLERKVSFLLFFMCEIYLWCVNSVFFLFLFLSSFFSFSSTEVSILL